jgi:hypothetical protein
MSDHSHPVGEAEAPIDPLLGTVIADRYHVEKRLGEGGMGAVYLARHIVLEKQVALKILHGEFSGRKDLVERFLHEAKAAARIRHEHVIDISDFGQTATGNPFFCMEVLFGNDLAQALRDEGQLAWPRIKSVFLQTCSALQAAHEKGIIHRDLKPENIFLIERLGHPDFVKVLDFGIAKLTELEESGKRLTKTGMVFGTPEYMSPEQARGDKTDHRVDVYAMGCILFQLVSGDVPFRAETFMGVLTRHLFEPVPPVPHRADIPAGLEAVVQRALDKDRDKRYPTMNDLAYAVEALDQVPGVAYYAPGARPHSQTGSVGALTQQPKTPAAGLVATASSPTRIGTPPPSGVIAAQAAPAANAASTATRPMGGAQAVAAVASAAPAAAPGAQIGVATESVRSFDNPPARPKKTAPWVWVAAGLVVVGGGVGAAVALSGGKAPAAPVAPAGPAAVPALTEMPDAPPAAVVPAVVTPDAAVAAVPAAAPVPDAAPAVVTPPPATRPGHRPRPTPPATPPGTTPATTPTTPAATPTEPPPKEPKEKEIKDPFKTGG